MDWPTAAIIASIGGGFISNYFLTKRDYKLLEKKIESNGHDHPKILDECKERFDHQKEMFEEKIHYVDEKAVKAKSDVYEMKTKISDYGFKISVLTDEVKELKRIFGIKEDQVADLLKTLLEKIEQNGGKDARITRK